jgi:hypothetical protein
MPDLDGRFFTGGGDIPVDIAKKLTIRDSSVRDRDVLISLGWEGQLLATRG